MALVDFLAGVAAAPERLVENDWISLLAPEADDQLKALLESAAGEVSADIDPAFSVGPAPAGRLKDLRARLNELELTGFVVPRTDEFQGEFVPDRAERLRWLTGFAGSAGVAIVLDGTAAIFVDGRYTLQVQDQVDTKIFEPLHVTDDPPWKWVAGQLTKGQRLGYDPWLLTDAMRARYQTALEKVGATLVPVETNPIDEIWDTQPSPPLAPVVAHDLDYAGETSEAKRKKIAKTISDAGHDAALISAPESVVWLLNVRGGDVPYTPLALSYAVLSSSGDLRWFVDPRKLAPGLAGSLGDGVSVEAIETVGEALQGLGTEGATVAVNKSLVPAQMVSTLEHSGATVVHAEDPCALPKASKNEVEISGMRAAHIRDGVALARFLAWLDRTAPEGEISEIDAATYLQSCRAEDDLIRDLSFRTISGAGANGAIVHYTVTPETNRLLVPGELYLVDSGAQYLDGTTDVTRTVYIEKAGGSSPTEEERDCFTRVLQGHIAIAMAQFPAGTNGAQIDILARRALWDAGLDYDHGTGHGVGSYLGVHEGPHRISKTGGGVALKPGMVISNEPGFYKSDGFGIRIENLVVVCERETTEDDGKSWLGFDTLTCAPIDRRLVKPNLMTPGEIEWLDRYHQQVFETLSPLVDAATAAWLETATRPLGR
ncbi:MAG TPA: X-Pro aminopeptidase [Rhodospirillaceae bacterium]|nr:X-Pro aminopeptidase [Rhodospirillaceae bacterium]HAA93227.1 X-Pro aminopeptidase [Rhodospirillaceae bacterium]HAT35182.1 X-Pro aminopeptidase [Rhodospirillaceae bacterium]